MTTVVIGAGFAGLAAATALAEAGATVSVFEARPGLGGRATAFRDPATGERIDNGQHVLAGCYSETLRFLRRIGTQNRLHRPASLRVPMIDERGYASVLALPPLPSPLHLLAGILAWQGLPLAERISVLRVAGALRRGPQPDAPPQTVRQWLNAHRQSARLSQMFWEPLALAALNQTVEVADVATFLAVLQRMFGPDPEAASLLLPAVPLDDLYARPAADYLRQAGSEVTTNAFCHVTHDGGRVTGVQVRDRHVPADTVIAAVPWFAFPDLFVSPPPALDSLIVNAAALAKLADRHRQPVVCAGRAAGDAARTTGAAFSVGVRPPGDCRSNAVVDLARVERRRGDLRAAESGADRARARRARRRAARVRHDAAAARLGRARAAGHVFAGARWAAAARDPHPAHRAGAGRRLDRDRTPRYD